MKDDDNNTQGPQPWIDPALEARVVASVLGETSAFEASELERALAKDPELAIFRRRIAAINILVATAFHPAPPKLRLSSERRKKLLETISSPNAEKKIPLPVFSPPKKRRIFPRVLFQVAAACIIVGTVATVLFSGFTSFQSVVEPPDFEGGSGGFVTGVNHVSIQDEKREAPSSFGMTTPNAPVSAPPAQTATMPTGDMIASLGSSATPVDGGVAQNQLSRQPLLKMAKADGAAKHPVEPVNRERAEAKLEEPTSFETRPAASQVTVYAGETSAAVGLSEEESNVADVGERKKNNTFRQGAQSTQIKAFTGGWGKKQAGGAGVSGAKDGLAKSKSAGHDTGRTDSLAMDENRELSRAPVLGDVPLTRDPFQEEFKKTTPPTLLTENVINVPVFSSRDGDKVVFDGFINYGSPIMSNGGDDQTAERTKYLIAEAKSFTEAGRYDLAFKRYEQTLQSDPHNIDARKGMEEVNTARANKVTSAYNEARGDRMASVDRGWELPVRHLWSSTSTQPQIAATGIPSMTRKLNEIVIPRIDFKDATVGEALEFLKQRAATLDAKETDPSRKGVNIVLQTDQDSAASRARITLSLTDVSLNDALKYVAELSGSKIKVEPYAVALVPQSEALTDMATKEYQVPSNVLSTAGAKAYLESNGVVFPPGASATYLPGSKKLIVKNTESNLDLVETLISSANPPSAPSATPAPSAFLSEIKTAKQPFSTFSLHVSDVSFQLAKDALNRGTRPDPTRIRPEEFYNAFDYNDPAPAPGQEVVCRIEEAAHPFLQQRDLVRIAVKVAAAGRAAGQPLRLTILLDTSGSMQREDRATSVRRALQTLASLLGPNDRVTLIGFARTPRLLAEQVPGNEAEKLVQIADQTPSEGGTNLELALKLASEQALKHFLPQAQNRIVLLTDGAANLGDANPNELASQITKTRQEGVSFDACGVGANGLNDEILEALTRKGDGRYYFLNRPEDADEGFARQLAGALRPAAENVKVQVVFNPSRVSQYRLIGFEKHLLKKEDFRNDKVQAAELSAEEAGVALYQVQPMPDGSGELGEVFVRFRDPASGRMVEHSWTIPYHAQVPAFDQATPSMQLAGTAAFLAEKLRGDDRVDLNELSPVLNNLRGAYPDQTKVKELIHMFEKIRP